MGHQNYEIRMEEFITGKGRTVDGKRIVELGKDKIKINLNIDASANPNVEYAPNTGVK